MRIDPVLTPFTVLPVNQLRAVINPALSGKLIDLR